MLNNKTGLPTSNLGAFLEERVNKVIQNEGCSETKKIIARVVSSSNKILHTHNLMKEKYSDQFPEQFPYRAKTLLIFQKIDGVEVCFFGMQMQEYGSDCLAPNTR